MNNDDLKKLRTVIKEEVTLVVKKELKPINEKLDTLWDQAVELTENITDVQETLGSHTVALKVIEENTQHNTNNLKKLDKRVTTTESHLGIVSPPELTITN